MKKFVVRILLFAYVLFASGAWAAPGIPDRYHKHLLDIKTPPKKGDVLPLPAPAITDTNVPLRFKPNKQERPVKLRQQSDGNLDPTCMGLSYDSPSDAWDVPSIPVKRAHSSASGPESCVMDGTMVAQVINPVGPAGTNGQLQFNNNGVFGGTSCITATNAAIKFSKKVDITPGCSSFGDVAIGSSALNALTTGTENVAIGSSALAHITTRSCMIGIGRCSLAATTTGNSDTSVGVTSLVCNTTGCNNSAFGRSSLLFNTTGSCNTAVGTNSLISNVSGNNNVAIGALSGPTSGTLSCTISIGRSVSVSSSHLAQIGNACAAVSLGSQFSVAHTPSQVNGIAITPSATGGTPTIAATGSDANIGISLATKGVASITLTGGIVQTTASKTGAYTATAGDQVILVNANTASFNVTMPATVVVGQQYQIIDTNASASTHTVTVIGNTGQTVVGASQFLTDGTDDGKSLIVTGIVAGGSGTWAVSKTQ